MDSTSSTFIIGFFVPRPVHATNFLDLATSPELSFFGRRRKTEREARREARSARAVCAGTFSLTRKRDATSVTGMNVEFQTKNPKSKHPVKCLPWPFKVGRLSIYGMLMYISVAQSLCLLSTTSKHQISSYSLSTLQRNTRRESWKQN